MVLLRAVGEWHSVWIMHLIHFCHVPWAVIYTSAKWAAFCTEVSILHKGHGNGELGHVSARCVFRFLMGVWVTMRAVMLWDFSGLSGIPASVPITSEKESERLSVQHSGSMGGLLGRSRWLSRNELDPLKKLIKKGRGGRARETVKSGQAQKSVHSRRN